MTREVSAGRFLSLTVLLSLATIAAAQTPQSTTAIEKGPAAVTTLLLNGQVEGVQGNSLVVKMSSGELRTFQVPESRRFIIDGKELTVHELKPGTQLTATVTTTMTPVMVRTTTVATGKVWFAMGKTVILTLPSGENKQYLVKDDTRFTVEGKPATVNELRAGMVVHAEKVVEEPQTDIATDTRVVGQAPAQAAAAPAVAAAPPTEAPATAPPQPTDAPAVAQAPPSEAPPTAQPEPTEAAPAAPVAAEQSAVPQTSTRSPRIILFGLLLVAAAIGIWMFAGRKSK